MLIRLQVIKVFEIEIETHDGDTTDTQAHIRLAENMQSTEIEKYGKLISVFTENAEVVAVSA